MFVPVLTVIPENVQYDEIILNGSDFKDAHIFTTRNEIEEYIQTYEDNFSENPTMLVNPDTDVCDYSFKNGKHILEIWVNENV